MVGKGGGEEGVDGAVEAKCHLGAAHRGVVGVFDELSVGAEEAVHVASPPFEQCHRSGSDNALNGNSDTALEMRAENVALSHVHGYGAVCQGYGVGECVDSGGVGHETHLPGKATGPEHCKEGGDVAFAPGSDAACVKKCQGETACRMQTCEQVETTYREGIESVTFNKAAECDVQAQGACYVRGIGFYARQCVYIGHIGGMSLSERFLHFGESYVHELYSIASGHCLAVDVGGDKP